LDVVGASGVDDARERWGRIDDTWRTHSGPSSQRALADRDVGKDRLHGDR
jgi:hypothetical protein